MHIKESYLRIWVTTKKKLPNFESGKLAWNEAMIPCLFFTTSCTFFLFVKTQKYVRMLIRGFFSGLNSTKCDNTNKHCVVEYLREKQLSKWSVLYTASGGCAFTKDRARLTLCKIWKFAKLISRNFRQKRIFSKLFYSKSFV